MFAVTSFLCSLCSYPFPKTTAEGSRQQQQQMPAQKRQPHQLGVGKQHRSKKGSGGEKLSPLPFPKVPRRAESTWLLPEDWLSVPVSPGGVGINIPWIFLFFFKYRTSVSIQKFLWMLGAGKGSENIHCIFSPGFLICSYVFQKGTKEKPHWDHNKSSVVLEEMRAYNLDKLVQGDAACRKIQGQLSEENTLVPQ